MRHQKWTLPCALTIAGSDPSGGAGVEADLKTFSALGVHGACVITVITVQNTTHLYQVFPIPAELVKQQIEKVLADLSINAVKIGVLYTKDIVKVVHDFAKKLDMPFVIDPVFATGRGEPLIEESAKKLFIRKLIPFAAVLTPNILEAEEICGFEIRSVENMRKAARLIAKRGPKAVIIKGGHLDGERVIDVALIGREEKIYEKTRLKLDTHGTGCTFSSAIASFLARGYDLEQSIEEAEKFINSILPFSLSVGKGRKPLHQFVAFYKEMERKHVITEIEDALKKIKDERDFANYVAAVGTQIAMALPYASSKEDIAAIEGRIVRFKDKLKLGNVKFGASTHMANVILTAMKYDPSFRAAMNLRYNENLIKAFKYLGFKISSFDRKREPMAVKQTEGLSLIWGTKEAIGKIGRVPDIIFDLGEPGKEAMIRLLGCSALDVVEKALKAIRFLKRKVSN